MKRYLILAGLVACIMAANANAAAPVVDKIKMTSFTCSNKNPPYDDPHKSAGSKFARMKCDAKVVKEYPFLDSWTLKPIRKDEVYNFNLVRFSKPPLNRPLMVVNMTHRKVCGKDGCIGAYHINNDGSYEWMPWSVSGTLLYSAICPTQFGVLLWEPSKKITSYWTYDGKTFKHAGNFKDLALLPECPAS